MNIPYIKIQESTFSTKLTMKATARDRSDKPVSMLATFYKSSFLQQYFIQTNSTDSPMGSITHLVNDCLTLNINNTHGNMKSSTNIISNISNPGKNNINKISAVD